MLLWRAELWHRGRAARAALGVAICGLCNSHRHPMAGSQRGRASIYPVFLPGCAAPRGQHRVAMEPGTLVPEGGETTPGKKESRIALGSPLLLGSFCNPRCVVFVTRLAEVRYEDNIIVMLTTCWHLLD